MLIMEKPAQIILHILLLVQLLGAAASEEGWWSIDCGAGGGSSRAANGSISWFPDTNYTKAGSDARVPRNQALEEMNSLRFFPNKSENNCYVIPLQFPGFNYIVRAGFYYGNYDGMSKPPTFDLKLDRENWTTVNTSSAAGGGIPIYHEAIYLTRSGNLTVCLVQTRDGEVPFISSLEGVPISGIYEEVLDTTTATLHLLARTNYGGSEVRYPDDRHNRIWTRGEIPSNCHANVSTPMGYSIISVNDEPSAMLLDYIESTNTTYPIILSVDLPHQSTPLPAYFVFYLADLSYPGDANLYPRIMQIYINGQKTSTVTISYVSSKVVSVYPMNVMGPTINITLVSTNQSMLPPMINGIEIFTRHDLSGQPGSPTSPYPSSTSRHFLSIYVILIHTMLLVALLL